jgi:hypothetical protein
MLLLSQPPSTASPSSRIGPIHVLQVPLPVGRIQGTANSRNAGRSRTEVGLRETATSRSKFSVSGAAGSDSKEEAASGGRERRNWLTVKTQECQPSRLTRTPRRGVLILLLEEGGCGCFGSSQRKSGRRYRTKRTRTGTSPSTTA